MNEFKISSNLDIIIFLKIKKVFIEHFTYDSDIKT